MKITALEVENFKRIHEVKINPSDGSLVIIGGPNKAGKSSILDALTAAFGGKAYMPEVPVREGAKAAEIRVELDSGALCIRRRVTAGGSHTLEITNEDGKIRSPQKMLDELVGARFLDPLRFAQAKDKEQREMLLGVVELDLDLDEWEKEYVRVYNARRDAGRDKRKAEAELEGISVPQEGEVGDPIDVDKSMQRMEQLTASFAAMKMAKTELNDLRSDHEKAKGRIEDLKSQLLHEENKLERLVRLGKAKKAEVEGYENQDIEGELEAVKNDIAHAAEHNRAINEAQAEFARYMRVKTDAKNASEFYDSLNAELENLDATKATALEKAKMPVPGLDIAEDHVEFNGVPLSQASGAEQLKVSLAIAMALSPNIQDIWVKDGSLLDDKNLELMRKFADTKGYRVWLERVGDRDNEAIVIENGGLRQPEPEEEPF